MTDFGILKLEAAKTFKDGLKEAWKCWVPATVQLDCSQSTDWLASHCSPLCDLFFSLLQTAFYHSKIRRSPATLTGPLGRAASWDFSSTEYFASFARETLPSPQSFSSCSAAAHWSPSLSTSYFLTLMLIDSGSAEHFDYSFGPLHLLAHFWNHWIHDVAPNGRPCFDRLPSVPNTLTRCRCRSWAACTYSYCSKHRCSLASCLHCDSSANHSLLSAHCPWITRMPCWVNGL